MQKLIGTALNSGIFIGRAIHISLPEPEIENGNIKPEDIPREIDRLQNSLSAVEEEINQELHSSNLPPNEAEIISTQREILRDPEIYKQLLTAIQNKLHFATQAVAECFANIINHFETLKVETFAVRAADYRDVQMRLLNALSGGKNALIRKLEKDQVPVLQEIVPSLVSKLAREGIKAYLVAKGSYNSHSSILSRALGLIAVANIPCLLEAVKDDDLLIVDGYSGLLFINPDEETLDFYKQKTKQEQRKQEQLRKLQSSASKTATGIKIKLLTNIGVLDELEAIKNLSCEGIGLFRTEFLYLGKQSLPSEEEQFAVYKELAEKMNPLPVTIRTFDLGGDKLAPLSSEKQEENPYLGNRGIRFSLSYPDIFSTQVRAILRASAFGNVQIMFPMIIDAEDFRKAKRFVQNCQQELSAQGITCKPKIPLGAMIEIPSAALCSEELARECDFLSIGTNDLVQYALAADRNNERVSSYYIQHHPAVLGLIKQTVKSAEKYRTPLSVCGEMASNPQYIPLLIGMGITELSVNPGSFLVAKSIIRKCDAHLFTLTEDLNFATPLSAVEHLIEYDLKPYYQNREE
ncbi:MAG: phosphoenolpyruvate--protein phosphotransferase [Candidatus Cloacimonas acidaminovorans]|nr:phosphoenolpyruvate--protein phosphotransferase [Candidatus Cloacimonas acidaminovorans]